MQSRKRAENNLTDDVRAMVMPSVPVARLVSDYLKRHPDPDYSTRAAQALADEYRHLLADGPADADSLFWRIVQYVASNDLADPKRVWGSLGIVTYYFELCDSYFKAIPNQPAGRIEALDMGRRSLHDEGANILIERLKGKIEIDFDTARRLFTLICVLHLKG